MTFKIMFDPGHGGKDPGACANGLRESDVVLKVAKYCREYIESTYEDVQVFMTRENDTFVGLSERAALANRLKVDYFCSIHINAGGGIGYEDYIYNGTWATKNRTIAIQNTIHNELIKTGLFVDRKTKQSDLAVLRETNMDSILTENGFIDNVKDAAILRVDANLKKIAIAHAHGFEKAFGWERKKVVVSKPQAVAKLPTKLDSPVGVKRADMVRLAKYIDTTDPKFVAELRADGYRVIELPK